MIATSPVCSHPSRIIKAALVGAVPVAQHHLRSLDAHLSALALGHLAVGLVEIDQLHVGVGQRQADEAFLALADQAGSRV